MKANALRPGDTIGIISPSWCGPATFPHRAERGAQYLESRGYHVRFAPHARGEKGYLSGTPEERADDIHQLFADPEVKAIIAAIGGDHSCQLLPLLDWNLIGRHPKIFMGYSDVTVLNLAIHARTGLVTFNGPALMTDFAEYPAPLPYTIDHWERAICRAQPLGTIASSPTWTEEFLDWAQKLDLTRARRLEPSPGWTWLKGDAARGRLLGGCIESLQHLRGTPWWPDMTGAILFLETSEEVPSPAWVDAVLQDYENMGVFGQITGLLIGRPMGYTPEQKAQLDEIVLERTRRYRFPIVSNMDVGHTAPQMTLPIGCLAEIDAGERRFAILEAAVEP
jgi:muramoyltetrapeptide carboxypeptidase